MGISRPRGIGGVPAPGVSSSPMGSLSGTGDMAQNSMGTNLSNTMSQQLHAGSLTPQAHAFLASRMRMAQSRGMLGVPQADAAGLTRALHAEPGSEARLMTGMSVHMNQQQLQQQMQQTQGVNKKSNGYKLNSKSTKADDYFRKPRTFSTQEVMVGLSNASNNDNVKDDNDPMPLSKSLVGGDINTSKIRVVTFSMPDAALSGNAPGGPRARTRLIMSVKPLDSTVAMHFGDMDDRDYLNAEDYLPSLATPHYADLLASQFMTLMSRDGHYFDNHVLPRPPRTNAPSTSQSSIPSSVNEMQQYTDVASGPQTHETKPIVTTTANQPPSLLAISGISSPGGNPMQMPQGFLHGGPAPSRPVQPDAQNQQQMMHQNQLQFSRSALLPPTTSLPQMNPMSHNSNMPMGGQMTNKPSLQMLQQPNQQQQQQQQPHLQQTQMQRKMMVGLGTAMGIGSFFLFACLLCTAYCFCSTNV